MAKEDEERYTKEVAEWEEAQEKNKKKKGGRSA